MNVNVLEEAEAVRDPEAAMAVIEKADLVVKTVTVVVRKRIRKIKIVNVIAATVTVVTGKIETKIRTAAIEENVLRQRIKKRIGKKKLLMVSKMKTKMSNNDFDI